MNIQYIWRATLNTSTGKVYEILYVYENDRVDASDEACLCFKSVVGKMKGSPIWESLQIEKMGESLFREIPAG